MTRLAGSFIANGIDTGSPSPFAEAGTGPIEAGDRLHVALINYCGPGYGTGSPIILQRHLRHLREAGHRVTLCLPEGRHDPNFDDAAADRLIEIPMRRLGWPPFRAGIKLLYNIRIYLAAKFLVRRISSSNITHIITTPYDIYSDIAIKVSEILNVPLLVIQHDQEELWSKTDRECNRSVARTKRALRESDIILPVTIDLALAYGPCEEKIRVLRPIPGSTKIHIDYNRSPKLFDFVYAGSIFNFHISFLIKLCQEISRYGGSLHIIADPNNEAAQAVKRNCSNVKIVQKFNTNDEAVQFVADIAATFLVIYESTQTEQAWSRTSFPSKLLDFCRSGVPIVIFAPQESAIGAWCEDKSWPTFSAEYNSEEISKMISLVSDHDKWMKLSYKSIALAEGEFNFNIIHQEFVKALVDTQSHFLTSW